MSDKKQISIKYFRGDQSACWGYRINNPLAEISKNCCNYKIAVTDRIHEKNDLYGIDVAVFQRQYSRKVFEDMLNMRRAGIKCVYETDDNLLNVPAWNPASSVFKDNNFKNENIIENIKYFVSNVDAIFVTTEVLAEAYRPYNENVYILPNSINFDHYFQKPNNSTRKVVLWQGSYSHKKDIALIEPALKQLVNDKDVLVKIFDFPIKVKGVCRVPSVPYNAFYQMLAQLDGYIGLAPLTTTPFNKYKSNIKFLEYTASNMLTIASAFGPYANTIEHEKTGILVADNKDWYYWVRKMLTEESEYVRILGNAKEFVKANYDISKNWVLWKNAFEKILGVVS